MRNDYFRYYHPSILIPLLIVLGIVFYIGNHALNSHWGVNVSIVSATSGLLFVIDKWWWKYRPFSWLFWSIDISGSYEGEIEYLHPETNKPTKKRVLIRVNQTGSSIQLISYFGEEGVEQQSLSESLQTSLTKDDHGNYQIVFTYLNEGNGTLGWPPHYGTNVLRVSGKSDKDRTLLGHYYTNREPQQTKGSMKAKFKSKK